MPLAQIADIKCSMVATDICCELAMLVPKLVVVTLLNFASIMLFSGISTLLKTIPLSIGAGKNFSLTFLPLCRAIELQPIALAIVFWLEIIIFRPR